MASLARRACQSSSSIPAFVTARSALATFASFEDLDHAAGADGTATLTDGEPQALFHRDRRDELDRHLGVVARHHHLRAARELDRPGDVGGPEVELRPVVPEE